ncbi:mitogen activated protein kinase 2 [Dimargaris xerosporica]|nr:mitogen activated protein kinase 2 [Dimargaris xerosporica]
MAANTPSLMTNLPAAIENRYKLKRDIGQGAYGLVCEAEDRLTGKPVAIKKVTRISEKEILTKRCLREIKLLRHFNGHDNIISLIDLEIANPNDFNEVYMIQELMEADLHQIVRSGQPLTDAHFQYFIFQICRGLKYIHSANVLHRDMKPGNLLVNADCELRICDFGLARGYADTIEGNAGFMTEYVATRWYRAPEIMLSFQSYTKAIDMWSVGCIFAELLGGRPLFKGRDYVDQLNQILSILGTPDDDTLRRIGSERAQMYIRSLPYTPKVSFAQLYPNATEAALDLLEKLLKFDPAQRITVEEVLQHPYLEAYHEPEDEPSHEQMFDFSFESAKNIEDIKRMIVQEVAAFKLAQRPQAQRRPSVITNVVDGQPADQDPNAGQPLSRDEYERRIAMAANHQAVPAAADMDVDPSELERELAGYIPQ